MRSLFRKRVVRSLGKAIQRRTLVDRSFRLANVTDLYVAQDHVERLRHEHSQYHHTEVKPRDISKQIVIDLSHAQGYRRGHIKGAINLSVEKFDFTRRIDTYGGITQDEVYNVFKNLGVGNDTSEVILYDNSGMLASRLWYVMRYFGFRNIRLLNGGWRAWLRSGMPIDEVEVTPKPAASLDLKPKRSYLLTKPTTMVFDVEHETSKYIDARRPTAYQSYHIEKAINIPSSDLMEDGEFKPVEDIRRRMQESGLDLENDRLIVYSMKSLSSAVNVFALQMVGAAKVSLYDAGVNNWRQNFDSRLPLDVEEHLRR